MDPMSQFEADRKLKEELEVMELADTIVLDDYYLSSRDLVGKGKEVHPTGKQRLFVQNIAASMKFSQVNRRKSTGTFGLETIKESEEDSSAAYFDLNAKPRILVSSGAINKLEPDSILRKFSKRFMFIFNDVIIVCSKKESAEFYEVQQVLWAQELRIKHLNVYSAEAAGLAKAGASSPSPAPGSAASDPSVHQFGFELIVAKTRKRAQYSMTFTCEDEAAKLSWIADIESMLLAYHKETDLSNQLGWFHEIIQGTFHSAAYLGDSVLLRRHLRTLTMRAHSGSSAGIDAVDESGMTALHWAVLRDHEVCVRILLDRGADVDALQKGLNTPLLLAALSPTNSETLCRLLIERGADLTTRNLKDHDVVFMAVLYGHASKGLPWLLQLLNAKGLDLNAPDGAGATPLHLCAKKNLARPIRMLVDSGADVNGKHGTTQLTPLQMACANSEPDVETIRSFLDKGAYPNWRDLQGRTAFDIVLHAQQQKQSLAQPTHVSLSQSVLLMDAKASSFATSGPNNASFSAGPGELSKNSGNEEDLTDDVYNDSSSDGASYDGEEPITSGAKKAGGSRLSNPPPFKGFGGNKRGSSSKPSGNSTSASNVKAAAAPAATAAPAGGGGGGGATGTQKWRAMETTIKAVGDWAVKALPALLEISKRGGRCRPQQDALLLTLRPSFRAAVEEAQQVWRKQKMPGNFLEFVLVREHSGEDLRLHKANWTKDKQAQMCQLCSESFNIRVRRHHCRSCGVLCCDECSNKRLVLSAVNMSEADIAAAASGVVPAASSKDNNKDDKDVNGLERVCDGCFNRLLHEAAQPSPDHFRVKQLKRCALDVIQSLEDLVDALDDPEGDPNSYQSTIRETAFLTKNLDSLQIGNSGGGAGAGAESIVSPTASKSAFSFKFGSSKDKDKKSKAGTAGSGAGAGSTASVVSPSPSRPSSRNTLSSTSGGRSGEALISALKLRDAKLQRTQDIVAKFLEATEGYQKVSKKLMEQKLASNRLWGAAATDMD